MDELGRLYGIVRGDVISLLQTLTPEQLSTTVAATPEWTVHQTLAHLSGIVEDATAGNMTGATTDPWTAAQVERGTPKSTEHLIEQWETLGAIVDQVITRDGQTDRIVVDCTTHEHDIRGALGLSGNRDSEPIRFAQSFVLDRWPEQCRELGLPAVVPAGDRFEQYRARMGRRSHSQIVAMFVAAGSNQPEMHARAFAVFGPSATEVHEPGAS